MEAEPTSASQRQDLKSGRKLWGPPGLKDRSLTVSERHGFGGLSEILEGPISQVV